MIGEYYVEREIERKVMINLKPVQLRSGGEVELLRVMSESSTLEGIAGGEYSVIVFKCTESYLFLRRGCIK